MMIFRKALSFLYPLDCTFCLKQDILSIKAGICRSCASLPEISNIKYCNVCSGKLEDEVCEFCNSRNIFFEKLISNRKRGDIEIETLRKIKFSKRPELGYFLRMGLGKHISYLKNQNFTGILKIPSNKKTRLERPFSAMDVAMKYISNKLKTKIVQPIEKKSSELQSGKSYRDRFLHARFAFEIKEKYKNNLSGNYLIIDDTFTTGATINEVSRILLENGTEKVIALVLTRSE